jgi:16S rRNA (adenine1518-N6/adenine1519-N6)-dimethyltransferase
LNYLQIAKKYRAKKSLGQNFLIDEAILDCIIDHADISDNETIIEIGSGLGFLTQKIARKAQKVIAIEIDPFAVDYLNSLNLKNVYPVEKDILQLQFSELVSEPAKVLANIPYYITTPILTHLLGEIDLPDHQNRQYLKELIIMVQKEVARRIIATDQSKNKEYGLLSILISFHATIEHIIDVPPSAFYPRPSVDSSVLKITPRQKPAVTPVDTSIFKKVIKASFTYRRKNLKNALINGGFSSNIVKEAMKQSGINEIIRGETLSMTDFVALSDKIYELQRGYPADANN